MNNSEEIRLQIKKEILNEELMKKIDNQLQIIQNLKNENLFLKQENQILKTKIIKFLNPSTTKINVKKESSSKKRKYDTIEKEENQQQIKNDFNFEDFMIQEKSEEKIKIEKIEPKEIEFKINLNQQQQDTVIEEVENDSNTTTNVSTAIFQLLQQKSPEQTISVRAVELIETILDNVDEMMSTKTIENLEKKNEIFEEENLNSILRSILPEKLANNAINYAKNKCKK